MVAFIAGLYRKLQLACNRACIARHRLAMERTLRQISDLTELRRATRLFMQSYTKCLAMHLPHLNSIVIAD